MKAVYPLGYQSVWHNNELRYSMRSLQYFKGIDEVVLIGQCPEWANVTHIPAVDGSDRIKNIWHKMEILSEQMREPFLFMADDIYFTRPYSSIPMYFDGDIDKKIEGATGTYKDMLIQTKSLLQYHHLPTLNYALHYPLIVLPEILKETMQYKGNYSWRTIYCNLSMHYGLQQNKERKDCKLWKFEDYIDNDIFSISNSFLCKRGKALFEQLYPNVAKYENKFYLSN